jgi:hypothetical protein
MGVGRRLARWLCGSRCRLSESLSKLWQVRNAIADAIVGMVGIPAHGMSVACTTIRLTEACAVCCVITAPAHLSDTHMSSHSPDDDIVSVSSVATSELRTSYGVGMCVAGERQFGTFRFRGLCGKL